MRAMVNCPACSTIGSRNNGGQRYLLTQSSATMAANVRRVHDRCDDEKYRCACAARCPVHRRERTSRAQRSVASIGCLSFNSGGKSLHAYEREQRTDRQRRPEQNAMTLLKSTRASQKCAGV